MAGIKKIEIKGYKSIKELDLTLNSINIFIGANGSGKSNFLSFFDFLKQIYNRNLQEFVALKGIDTFLHKGDAVEISAHLLFRNTNGYSFTLKKGDRGLIFTKEEMWYEHYSEYPSPFNIASLGNESTLRNQTMPRTKYIRAYIDQLAKYHFHDTGENSPFNKESNIENDKFFFILLDIFEKCGRKHDFCVYHHTTGHFYKGHDYQQLKFSKHIPGNEKTKSI